MLATGSAEWVLKQLSDLTASSDGFLFLREGAQLVCAAHLGSSGDEDEVARWAAQCLSALDDDDLEATRVTNSESTIAPNRLKVDSRRYRLSVLRSASDASDNVLGAIVLSGSADIPVAVMRRGSRAHRVERGQRVELSGPTAIASAMDDVDRCAC